MPPELVGCVCKSVHRRRSPDARDWLPRVLLSNRSDSPERERDVRVKGGGS